MEAFAPQSAQDRIPGQNITPTAVCINNQRRLPVCMLSCFSHVQFFATLWMVACRAPLSKEFSPGKNTGVGCHALLQGIFPTQGSNPHLLHLLHWQLGSLPPAPPGKPPVKAAAAKSLQSCPTLCDPIDRNQPGSPVPGFSRQEHWSGLPFPSPMHESEKSK